MDTNTNATEEILDNENSNVDDTQLDYKAMYEEESKAKIQLEEELKKARFTLNKNRVEAKSLTSKEEVEQIAKAMAENEVASIKEEYALNGEKDEDRIKIKEIMITKLSSIKDPIERVNIAKTLHYAEVNKLKAEAVEKAGNSDSSLENKPNDSQPTGDNGLENKLTPAQEGFIALRKKAGDSEEVLNKLTQKLLEQNLNK